LETPAELWRKLKFFFRRGQLDRDLEEEMQYHVAMKAEAHLNRQEGMSPGEARNAAQREFGNTLLLREKSRDMWDFQWLEALLQDLRFGLRQLRRNPGFTAVAILTLALGIGANSAIFSLIDAVMLRDLPVENPRQLVLLSWVSPKWPNAVNEITSSMPGTIGTDKYGHASAPVFSYPVFKRLASQKSIFSHLFGVWDSAATAQLHGNSISVSNTLVTGDFFACLGIRPILGRAITPADDRIGAPPVTVLAYKFWLEHFSGDPSVVGQTIALNRVPFTVVGVAPPKFFGIEPGSIVDLWTPMSQSPAQAARYTDRGVWWLTLVGRLKPGVTVQQARAALDVTLAEEATSGIKPSPKPNEIPRVQLSSAARGLDYLRTQFSDPLLLMFIAVGLILLIGCANVAGLMLARGTTRSREMCVRVAIGASRGRIVRQLLTESLILAVAGGALGLLLAVWGSRVLLALASPPGEIIPIQVGPDALVLVFTLGISIVTAILFGLAPALRATRVDINAGLKENPGSMATLSPSRLRPRKALVIVEAALSMVLLVGAGLFVRTLQNLETQKLGFNPHHVLLFHVSPSQQGYKGQRLASFYEELVSRIRSLPGVESASLSELTLLSGGGSDRCGIPIAVGGKTARVFPKSPDICLREFTIGPGFAKTLGIPLLAGRDLNSQDAVAGARKVALINEAMAKQLFGSENPVGQWFALGPGNPPKVTVVGVIPNIKYMILDQKYDAAIYYPYSQQEWPRMSFAVRTRGDPHALIPALRALVASVDRNIPVSDLGTQEETIAESLSQQRLFARLSTFFGLLALLLVCVALYGLVGYSVAQRTHEIGIRMALGAEPARVLRMIVRESLVLVFCGGAVGVAAALATTRLLRSFLFGVKPGDPATVIASFVMMVAVSAIATYLPARRAMRVDPMVALRYE